MDTRQLAAFCAVVELKSFSQAAERLGVTQPAVSLQVRSLEKRLGRKLLDRSGRRVEPTAASSAARFTSARRPAPAARSSRFSSASSSARTPA
jgi:DNA-binding transcriptional LysR family regulator